MSRASSLITLLAAGGLAAVAYLDLQADLRRLDGRLAEAEKQLGFFEPLASLLRPAQGASPTAAIPDPWAPVQATGAPDAGTGESPRAWCPARENAGLEWIELTFPAGTLATALRLFENLNPGAVHRITAEDGQERSPSTPVELWAAPAAPWTGVRPRTIQLAEPLPVHFSRLRLHLDTAAAPGWNEIDAVAAVAPDGTVTWAQSATASSFWTRGQVPDD